MVIAPNRTIAGTWLAGAGVVLALGINFAGVGVVVLLVLYFVATPAMLYLDYKGRVDPERVFRAGAIYGVGLYLFSAAISIVLYAVLDIEGVAQPLRIAAIPVFGYVVATRV